MNLQEQQNALMDASSQLKLLNFCFNLLNVPVVIRRRRRRRRSRRCLCK